MIETSLLAVTYASVFKVVFVLVMFALWCACVQWVDRDAQRVKTMRERWNILCLTTGVLALFIWLVIPANSMATFFLGWGVYVILCSSGLLWFVAHRNKRVADKFRVLTGAHFARLLSSNKDKAARDQDYRVRLFNHDNKPVMAPDDPEEADRFATTQELLYDAIWRRSSEIDVAAVGGDSKLIYRIDGVASERQEFLTPEQAVQAIEFLKLTAGLDPEEKRRPQHGAVRAGLLGGADPSSIEVRCSGTRAGERMQLKIMSAESKLSLNEVGIHPKRVEKFKKVTELESGMVIAAGPTASGVTTSLYGIIGSHDAYIQNIHSLEKQCLLEVDNITQHAFDANKSDVTYARQLQSVLRREPDVVMVGELDDTETAQVCIRSAAEGKKIYAGMTANDSFEALDLLVNLAGSRKAVAKVLKGVTCQRLVRKLCPTCREAYKPDPKLLKKANLPVNEIEHFYRPPTQPIYDKQGREIICPTCQGTGHVGRIGIFEVLVIEPEIAKLIAEGATATQIKQAARKKKMLYMQEEGLLKTMEGVTSINEILRALRSSNNKR
jgi:type II secretory ATPase GspE/PulE/Tfp pilus assembly ATPase PilB-like protein